MIKNLISDRIELISSSSTHIRIELETPQLLSEKLNADVSSDWPPGEYDRDAMVFFLSCFENGGEAAKGWYGWYAINIDPVSRKRVLVGSGGYFGPPDSNGVVEIGYSVLPEWQRQGYATEIVKALVLHASSFDQTNSIVAHTAPDNEASKKVLISNGFREVGVDDGNLRFEHTR
ncbi:GNAT family N-acetyltransferase [Marinomonas maritima]|uniref:GNAT family N-acetyltransferase n=1 Tax=Marinomonas maritima TaxID=2940935 RepID=UPI002938EE8D|nr:GNAT family N-acetyltransferase [Marinomonas maritima]